MIASARHWRILAASVTAVMIAAFAAPRWIRPPVIQENRVLAQPPGWPRTLEELGRFRQAADAYVADRFPPRPHLIALLNRIRMMAGVSGSSRVIVGRNGWLFYDDDSHLGASRGAPPWSKDQEKAWLRGLAGRTEALKAQGVPYLVVAPPTKEAVYPQFAPAWYPGVNPDRPAVRMARLARESGAGEILYLHSAVAAAERAGLTVYSRHDTHWTGYGAYAGYAALMDRLHALGLSEPPRPLSAFRRADSAPVWTPRDLSLMLAVSSFVDLDYPRLKDPAQPPVRTVWLTSRRYWTAPHVIETGQAGKPVVLLTMDSFSNELLPFLYSHFSRLILAHNQDGSWRPDLIARFKPDIVVLEVQEAGLGFSLNPAPEPSPEAVARIEAAVSPPPPQPAAPAPPPVPELGPPSAEMAQAWTNPKAAADCNLETASVSASERGPLLTVSGWIYQLTDTAADPRGLVRLVGPAGEAAGAIAVNRPRPDVAQAKRLPAASASGFDQSFRIPGLKPGAYRAAVYRRASTGWIVCTTPQRLTVR